MGPGKLNNIEEVGCESGTQSDLIHLKWSSSAEHTEDPEVEYAKALKSQ